MTPNELKQWQADLGLSEVAMAHYLGIPVHTLKKWINGTRTPDAAPLRLFGILQRIEREALALHAELIRESRASAPESAPGRRGRPPKGIGATQVKNAPEAPESPDPGIPAWLSSAL